MYFKALELQGFKSFPQKTRLTFDQAITAVVGPNGSGKSNIADAIRWVMGEQSTKNLRGGKMEDVIFGGTQKRKPMGYAEVSLVLDNTQGRFPLEEQEIMVTRRYYRSGDSEYYINRRSCRLRDIHELFMDTGLGREGYSIIGQGKIDEILSTKSAERRGVFEEAAGISRYRHRKEEAERKLERTEENLLRIGDKIDELELQVEPLRAQAETAQTYLRCRDELRILELSLWLEQLEGLRNTKRKLLSDTEHATQQRESAADAQEQLYAQAEALGEQMRQRELALDTLRQEATALTEDIQTQESHLAVLTSQLQSSTQQAEQLEQELAQQQERADSVAAQVTQHQQRLTQLDAQRNNLAEQKATQEAQSAQLEGQLTRQQNDLAATQTQAQQCAAQTAQAKETLSALTAAAQGLLDQDTALKSQLLTAEERIQTAQTTLDEYQTQWQTAQAQLSDLDNAVAGYRLRLEQRGAKEQQANQRVQQLTVEARGLDSRIAMLEEMERAYEGYSKAVKTVMRASGKHLQGIHGPVAGLLRVPDEYAVAIEIALGGTKQYIVVENESDGKRAIQYLKQRDGGRATFLPLTTIQPNRLRERDITQCPGFVGVASDLVEYDPRYTNIVARLLGTVVIAEDFDRALAMAKRYHYKVKIVTLDGQVLNPGGSMTGGSHSRAAGILSRAVELERLCQQRKTLAARQKNAQTQLETAARARRQGEIELEDAQENRRAVETEAFQHKSAWERQQAVLDGLNEQQTTAQAQLTQLTQRSDQLDEQLEALQDTIAQLQTQSECLTTQQAAQNETLTRLQTQREILRQTLAELTTQDAALTAEQETTRRALTQLQDMERLLSGDRVSWQSRQAQCHAQAKQVTAQMADTRTQLTHLRTVQAQQAEQMQTLTAERLALEGQRSQADRAAREKNQELLHLERACSALEQKNAAAAMEEKQILDKLWDSYGLTVDSAQPLRQELESHAKATRRIAQLKREMRDLGSVNLGAITEFQRVSERYDYLTGQRADVLSAKADLTGIIDGITAEMERIFGQQFQRINTAFSQTFVELFGGGRAALELEDENDSLNCGIEIRVQPPGKTLKVLSLLSGGEKAFVAIALYFALLKVRPTPFVVMDEIEAALDENNVARFARYLRNISDQTQFIVITHRRGTMEKADVLYGVTMQERGVSQVLAMDLNAVETELHLHAT